MPGGQHNPVVGVVVDRGSIAIRGHRPVGFTSEGGVKEFDREHSAACFAQIILDRRVIRHGFLHRVGNLGSGAEPIDGYMRAAVLVSVLSHDVTPASRTRSGRGPNGGLLLSR
jgi:hypothetical protein